MPTRWAVVLLACLPLAGQSVRRLDGTRVSAANIDARVASLLAETRLPGLGLAIINDGKLVYLKGHGVRNAATGAAWTPGTVTYGASLTKATFAWFVVQMAREGRLDLDKPIGEMLPRPLPEYAKYADLQDDPRWRKLTLRILLSHTAGFPNFRFFLPDGRIDDNAPLRFYFEPGSRYAYSGEGINLAQFVLELALGIETGAAMRERIFDRLGMTRTSMTWSDAFESDLAVGHDASSQPQGHRRRGAVRAAGSMDTTLADYARFLLAVCNGEGLDREGRELLFSPQVRIRSRRQFPTLDEATTDAYDSIRLSYGLGWGLYWTPHGRVAFKEGNGDGFLNHAAVYEKNRSAVLILTNGEAGARVFTELLEFVAGDRWMPWDWEGYARSARP